MASEQPERRGNYLYPNPVTKPDYFFCVCPKCEHYRKKLKGLRRRDDK